MGYGIAQHLYGQGLSVSFTDVTQAAIAKGEALGLRCCDAPSECCHGSDVMLICVVDAVQIRSVIAALDPADLRGKTVLLMSTIAPEDAAIFAQQLNAMGAAALDCPMSGGPARAASGQLTLMVAGANAQAPHNAAYLNALGNKVVHISSTAGDAMRAKLVNNLLAGIQLIIGSQALQAGQAVGLDAPRLFDLIQSSSGQSWIAGDRLARALANDYAARSEMTVLTKDVRLALAFLRAQPELPTTELIEMGGLTLRVFERALAAGLHRQDDCAVFKI